MKTVGIISALRSEAEIIINEMKDKTEVKLGQLVFYKGKVGDKNVVVTITGCGKVAAATYTEAMILGFSPEVIINTGVAGSLSEKVGLYDVVVATKLCQHDMDTSAIGDPKGMISGLCVTFMETDKNASDSLFAIASSHGNAVRGIIASGDKFIADKNEKCAINAEFGAVACEMEGGAVAQTAYTNKVPFTVIRIISDSLTDDSAVEYSKFATEAAHTLSGIILEYLK